MKVSEFAKLILFGTTLEEKLAAQSIEIIETEPKTSFETPRFPGRPPRLSKIGKAEFPSTKSLSDPSARGKVLHFFANHELLAMEIMALMLLRFQDAPAGFRQGIVQTISEEQAHLRLYLKRMQELGVDFGDLPVNDFFWNCLKNMRSPLDYITQMSLTFEQANLDYSIFYRDAVLKHGDTQTAEILERVCKEEIGHVKHGLTWFNRLRENSQTESEWEAYKRLLPPPMTPRRAKGVVLDQLFVDVRKQAGFTDEFIRELELYSGSRGRPAQVWLYNPLCDTEISSPEFTPTETTQKRIAELEHIPMFLADSEDVVLVSQRPPLEWLEQIKSLGWDVPDFQIHDPETGARSVFENRKFCGFQPWGWSPKTFNFFKSQSTHLISTHEGNGPWCQMLLEQPSFSSTSLHKLFSKAWSAEFLRHWSEANLEGAARFGVSGTLSKTCATLSEAVSEIESLLSSGQTALAKVPFSTSGRGIRRFENLKDLNASAKNWIKNILEQQKQILIEPWLNKVQDLSVQFEVKSSEVHIHGIRAFMTGPQMEYRGALLGQKLGWLGPEMLRFLNSGTPSVLELWKDFVVELGNKLRELGFQGAAGIDGLLWKNHNSGTLHLKPLLELNPRWTMGRVALSIEKNVSPRSRAAWVFVTLTKIQSLGYANFNLFITKQMELYPTRRSIGSLLLEDGIVVTSPPLEGAHSAHSSTFEDSTLLTFLVIGSALEDPTWKQLLNL